ncbi:MAG: hypothetical protein ACXVY8_07830 [Gaiellaceae bacterium]
MKKLWCLLAAVPFATAVIVAAAGALAATARSADSVNFGTPKPVLPSTARLAVDTGTGAQRLALYLARNADGELCVGVRLGSGPPKRFECFRRGLAPPVVAVAAGGGKGADEWGDHTRWGSVVGIADASVGDVAVLPWESAGTTPQKLLLEPLGGGLRLFRYGPGNAPGSFEAHDRAGATMLSIPGLLILSPCERANSCPTGPQAASQPPWSVVVPLFTSGTRGRQGLAAAAALALPFGRGVLTRNGGWLRELMPWWRCDGTSLGYVVVFHLRSAASFTETVPMIRFTEKPVAYEEGAVRLSVRGLTDFGVFVDLNRRKAVGVEVVPGSDDSVESIRMLKVVRPFVPAGGPDSTDCHTSSD